MVKLYAPGREFLPQDYACFPSGRRVLYRPDDVCFPSGRRVLVCPDDACLSARTTPALPSRTTPAFLLDRCLDNRQRNRRRVVLVVVDRLLRRPQFRVLRERMACVGIPIPHREIAA